jgi:long-chain acyl-CoA synthetase
MAHTPDGGLSSYILRMSAHGRRTAFLEQGVYRARFHTYNETLERARACAAWLRGQGLQRERVILWAKPGAGWVIAFYGCILGGAVVVPIDAGFSAEFVARVREKTGARLTITDQTFPTLETLPAAPDFQPAVAARDDLAEIVFTSGTTAEPRGVMITHGNLLANLEPVEHEIKRYLWMAAPFSPIRFVNLIPLSHLFGQVMGLFIPQLLGGTVIFPESQSPAFIAATIRRRRASVMVSVPQQLEALGIWTRGLLECGDLWPLLAASNNENPPQRGYTPPHSRLLARWWKYRKVHRTLGWKMWAFVVGGAPLPPAVGELWGDMGYAVIQGYGLTETAPAITITHPFRQGGAGSVGIRLAGVETRVAADGEILVRGPNVSPGYYGEPPIAAGGWLHTGDLGRFDEQGNLFFLGRKKDVIVTASGLNVYPADVERALEAQPEIEQAAVVGKESGGGVSVHAVVVTRGSGQTVPEAITRVNATLEPYQRIQGFSVWPESVLPRTVSTKKLQRATIAAWVNGQSAAATAAPAEGWRRFFTERGIALERLTPAALLEEDLGLSSLDRVELLTLLETENPASLGEIGVALQTKLNPADLPANTPQSVEPDWPRSRVAQVLRAIFRPLILFPLLRWYVKVEAGGAENLTALSGPALFVANHTSFMDVPVILRALPRRWREALAPAMSPDHFAKPWQLNLTRLCFNGFLLTPDAGAVKGALRHAGKLVEAGHAILMFPEGRLTPDGAIHTFRPGAGVMAEHLSLPVVPIRVDGLYEVWPEHQYKPGKGRVRVTIGAPLTIRPGESPAAFTTRIEGWFSS